MNDLHAIDPWAAWLVTLGMVFVSAPLTDDAVLPAGMLLGFAVGVHAAMEFS